MAKKSKTSKTEEASCGGPGVKDRREGTGKDHARQKCSRCFSVKRREEVAVKDREEFQTYLTAKEEADAKKKASMPAVAEKALRLQPAHDHRCSGGHGCRR